MRVNIEEKLEQTYVNVSPDLFEVEDDGSITFNYKELVEILHSELVKAKRN